MFSQILQISFLFILFYISNKLGSTLIYNYILGLISLFILTNLSFEGSIRSIAEVPIFIFNLILYTVLFISSVFIYLDKENEKRHYSIVPYILYLIIVVMELFALRFDRAFGSMFLPILLAFFPIYILKCYKKYLKDE